MSLNGRVLPREKVHITSQDEKHIMGYISSECCFSLAKSDSI